MTSELCDPAPRRLARQYMRDMGLAGLVYAVVLIGSVYVVRHTSPPRELDEFQRRVELKALAVAAAVVGFASFTYRFLQSFAGLPQIEDALMWVFPALCFTWGIAQIFVRRRHQ